MPEYIVSGVYDGWRLDTIGINAKDEKEAKKKFKALYKKSIRKTVSSIIVSLW